MNKETEKKLKKKLEDAKNALIANSSDAHYAEKLVKDMLSAKGQLSVEKLPIYDLGKELESFEGETFKITKFSKAVVYHIYNGFDFVVRPESTSLYQTLVDYVDNKDEYSKLHGDDKEIFDLDLSAKAYILALPRFVFTDAEFTYKIATEIVEYLRTKSDELLDAPLQEETPELDEKFKDASIALENVKESLK